LTPEIKPAKTGFLSTHNTGFTVLKTGGFYLFSGPENQLHSLMVVRCTSQHLAVIRVRRSLETWHSL